ncbi:MAG: polymerase subunit sigma-24 [Thermoleophilia bacterium]|nr:polymerase subunit sigma-24 [Thermoleophilia bacterium]
MQRTAEQRALHAEWMRLVADGDAAAFEQLYDEFGDLVYSIAIGMLRDAGRAEDAAQDVWIKVWNASAGFDPTRASVATWITTLAHRHVIDLIRRAKVRAADRPGAEPGDETAARVSTGEDVATDAVNNAYTEDIRAAMAQLSEDQRRALELSYFQGYSQSEIAELLGKPLGTVKTYMFQGMRRLRELLDADSHGERTTP